MHQKESENAQEKILELLRDLPHPGKIFLDFTKNGVPGYSLKPIRIPNLSKKELYFPTGQALQLVKRGKIFLGGCTVFLNFQSTEWQKWINKQPPFIIKKEDVGKGLDVIEKRRKNFDRNLLHKFLKHISLTLSVPKEIQKEVIHSDNYPLYFWDKAICISGKASSINMESIGVNINGLNRETFGLSENFYVGYWQFLSKIERFTMETIIKWHKALISLYHLTRRDKVNIPIDFEELQKTCWDEIKEVMKK